MANKLLVFAGPNGSGKSTLYHLLLSKYRSLHLLPFINPDDIAKELHGSFLHNGSEKSNRVMLAAGKRALQMRKELLSDDRSFGFETTLSGNSEKQIIQEAVAKGYDLYIIYVALDDPLLNVQRVKARVQNQGHFVEPLTVIRRYFKSLQNIKEMLPLSKGLYLFDNSGFKYKLLASMRESGARGDKNILIKSSLPEWAEGIVDSISLKSSLSLNQ